jgi:hypothetical protein
LAETLSCLDVNVSVLIATAAIRMMITRTIASTGISHFFFFTGALLEKFYGKSPNYTLSRGLLSGVRKSRGKLKGRERPGGFIL